MSQENVEIVERLLAGFNRRESAADVEALIEKFFEPAVIWEGTPEGANTV